MAYVAAETAVAFKGVPAGAKADVEAASSPDFAVVDAREKDGVWTWTVVPLSTGTAAFTARWLTDDKVFTASAPPFKVIEAEMPKDADILDIKPPMRALPPLWPLLLAVILASAAWWAWDRWRKRPAAAGPAAPAAPARPAEEVAAEAIQGLLASGLWEKDQAAYYFALTEILRAYLEARYGKPATAMTSAEVARLVKARAGDLKVGGAVRELLNRADLVKFAKAKPAPDEGPKDAALALEVVEATTPRLTVRKAVEENA